MVENQVKRLLLCGSRLFVLGMLLLVAGGCAATNPGSLPQTGGNSNAGGYEVVDSTGYVLKLAQKPQKIVSLSVSTDEILLALVNTERIAALTQLSGDSGVSHVVEQAKAVPRKIQANPESVIALQPDLVIMPDWLPPALSQTLRDAGLPVYVYKTAATIDEVKQSISRLAGVVGEKPAGEQVVAAMDSRLTGVQAKVKDLPPDSRPVIIRFSLMGDGGGKGSTFEDICRYAGVVEGATLAGLSHEETLSKEQLVGINPDVILLPVWDYSGKTDIRKFAENIKNDPALQNVKAIQNNRMLVVPDKDLTSTSQYIVDGVEAVARAAHPQLF